MISPPIFLSLIFRIMSATAAVSMTRRSNVRLICVMMVIAPTQIAFDSSGVGSIFMHLRANDAIFEFVQESIRLYFHNPVDDDAMIVILMTVMPSVDWW